MQVSAITSDFSCFRCFCTADALLLVNHSQHSRKLRVFTVQLPFMKAGHDLILAVPCSKSRLSIIDQFSDPRALGAFGVIYATLLEPAQTEIPPLENRVD